MNKIKLSFLVLTLFLVYVFVYFVAHAFVEPKAYDYMTKTFLINRINNSGKQIYGSKDIVLVVIDKKTNDKYMLPWKREKLCKILDYFSEYAKPKIVVCDWLISNYDTDNPESDKKFFRSMSKYNKNNLVTGFFPLRSDWEDAQKGEEYDNLFAKKYSIKVQDETTNLKYYKNGLIPFAQKYLTAVQYHSLMQFPKDYMNSVQNAGSLAITSGDIYGTSADDIFRTHEYILKYNGNFYPSIALKTFLMLNNNPRVVLKNNEIVFPELQYKIKYRNVNGHSHTPIRFYNPSVYDYSHQYLSAVDIMDAFDDLKSGKTPAFSSELFKDKIIIIGTYVPGGEGQNDNKNTPVRAKYPGVDCQACAIDNILHNDFLNVLPRWFNVLVTLFGMFLVYLSIRKSGLIKSIVYSLLIVAVYYFICAVCFYFKIVIDVITPIIMFILTITLAYLHKFLIENQNKEKVESAMGKYISKDVMQRVLLNIDNLGLGGKKAIVSVLFADIRSFTAMSEKMSAQQVSELLNEYFTAIEPIITQNNGIINKFIGDAVMAVFGEPIQDENHAYNAIKSGLEMLDKVQELNKKWKSENRPEIAIGVGVNTGEVFIGNIGSINRMEYTVIGDTVNLASRLEGYNKIYKTKFLISENTYESTKNNFEFVEIPDVEIRGKAEKMNIYEVKGWRDNND